MLAWVTIVISTVFSRCSSLAIYTTSFFFLSSVCQLCVVAFTTQQQGLMSVFFFLPSTFYLSPFFFFCSCSPTFVYGRSLTSHFFTSFFFIFVLLCFHERCYCNSLSVWLVWSLLFHNFPTCVVGRFNAVAEQPTLPSLSLYIGLYIYIYIYIYI